MIETTADVLVTPELPFTKVDALVVLGIGGNTRLLGPERQTVIENPYMRINAIAAKILASHGNLSDSTAIVPTGQGTELVDWHYERLAARQKAEPDPSKSKYLEYRDAKSQPVDLSELKRSAAVTQGELMSQLIRRAIPKGAELPVDMTQVILEETVARNTILNFIEALNLLDERSKGVWEGNLAVLTTNTGHLQRSLAIARVLGLGEILPVSSEQALIHYGYDKGYLEKMLLVSDSDLREHEKNLRAIYEIPEFVVPELVSIKSDIRLQQVLVNISKVYGPRALESFGIQDASALSADELRNRIRAVGEEQTRLAFDALSDDNKSALGIDQFDRKNDIEKIRRILASDVKATEKVRDALIEKYGEDTEWFESHGLPNIKTTEAYRIKNWFFGRKLPSNEWRDSADLGRWRDQNKAFNEMTDTWINETSAKGGA